MNVKFYELAVGAEFTAFGRAYQKVAMSMAEVLAEGHQADGHQAAHPPQAKGPLPGSGWVFMGLTEVVSDGPLLPPEVAERWRPVSVEAWAEHLAPAPGQVLAACQTFRSGTMSE